MPDLTYRACIFQEYHLSPEPMILIRGIIQQEEQDTVQVQSFMWTFALFPSILQAICHRFLSKTYQSYPGSF